MTAHACCKHNQGLPLSAPFLPHIARVTRTCFAIDLNLGQQPTLRRQDQDDRHNPVSNYYLHEEKIKAFIFCCFLQLLYYNKAMVYKRQVRISSNFVIVPFSFHTEMAYIRDHHSFPSFHSPVQGLSCPVLVGRERGVMWAEREDALRW
jgi:hypothetical protein